MSEMAAYPVSGVSSQHATVSVATPITAVIYSLNGAKEGASDEMLLGVCRGLN